MSFILLSEISLHSSSSSIALLRQSLTCTNRCFSHHPWPLGPVVIWVEDVGHIQPCSVFDIIQPHHSRPSSSSLLFYYALQQLHLCRLVFLIVCRTGFHIYICTHMPTYYYIPMGRHAYTHTSFHSGRIIQ